jgi:ribosome-associated protein
VREGPLWVAPGVLIAPEELEWRATTSGGPGGQHANRTLSRVVLTFRPGSSTSLSDEQRRRVVARLGEVVRTSASRRRSQGLNRVAAREQLAVRLADALEAAPERRASRPTASARRRRVDEKRARGRLKEQRRAREDD